MSANPRTTAITNQTTTYRYDPKGQLIQSNDQRFTYDKAGNNLHSHSQYNPTTNHLLQNSTHTFSYDKRGNLIAKTEKATNNQTRYHYNTLNQLIKVVTPTDTLEY